MSTFWAIAVLNPGIRVVWIETGMYESSMPAGRFREIQRTGDIFFPTRWTAAVLGGHNSSAAAETVRTFLAANTDYPPRLRQIIEQSADPLFRAARIHSNFIQ